MVKFEAQFDAGASTMRKIRIKRGQGYVRAELSPKLVTKAKKLGITSPSQKFYIEQEGDEVVDISLP